MPLDHYVPQVHLKNFYSLDLDGLMYAISKSDQKQFTPNAKSVCRIDNNSTNKFLNDNRIIEEFLKDIEPKYNKAVRNLIDDNIQKQKETIYTISGFVAYVLSCAPAGMRIESEPQEHLLEQFVEKLDHEGIFPPPPASLAGENFSSLFKSQKNKVDPKFTQAVGINSVLSLISIYGNSSWEILMNPFDNNPFFTSDYPIIPEKAHARQFLNTVVPLTPSLAIRIIPNTAARRIDSGYSFTKFSYKQRKLNKDSVDKLNRLIVQCAESVVFSSRMYDWMPKFVKKYSKYRIKSIVRKNPINTAVTESIRAITDKS